VKLWEIIETHLFGGPGSGNYGHKGRPGKRGGSVPTLGMMVIGDLKALDSPHGDVLEDPQAIEFVERGQEDAELRDHSVRGWTKNAIVTELAARSGLPYDDVNEVVKQWSYSSNDEDYRSLSLQESISEEFGIPMSPWQKELASRYGKVWDDPESREAIQIVRRGDLTAKEGLMINQVEYEKAHAFLSKKYGSADGYRHVLCHREDPRGDTRKVLRAMYNYTQDELAKRGVKEVVLFRGKRHEWKDAYRKEINTPGTQFRLISNSASAWSARTAEAANFGHVIAARVPANRILGTAQTGFGCLREREYVVLGGGNDTVMLTNVERTRW